MFNFSRQAKVLIPALCLIGGGLVGAILAIVVSDHLLGDPSAPKTLEIKEDQNNSMGGAPITPVAVPDKISGRYLMAGTIVWDRGVEAASRRSDGSMNYAYPFEGLATYKPESYDAWVADLECPISSHDVPAEHGHSLLEFNCLPEFLPYAKPYFQFFNLSNNHADNSGQAKLEATRRLLEAADIQAFGDPEPGRQDLSCQVVALPIKLWDSTNQFQAVDIPVAFCAWHYFYRLPAAGEIEVMKEYAELMPVFAFLHMGAEYSPRADSIQQSIAHQVIDLGADFVIANNPHWVQNAELYRDKLIVYSTGNFIFDQAFNEEVKRSANIVVEVSAVHDDNLAAWLDLGPTCATANDDCLGRAQAAGLKKFNFDIRFEVIAGYLTNHQQAIADEDVQTAVRQRLGWEALFETTDNQSPALSN